MIFENPLNNYLIKFSYPINYNYFITPSTNFSLTEEGVGFLIPLSTNFVQFFDFKKLADQFSIIRQNQNEYLVRLIYYDSTGKISYFEKIYADKSDSLSIGKIISVNLYFAFFPLFKVLDKYEYNDFYKIMVVDDNQDYKNVNLNFYDEQYNLINNGSVSSKYVKRVNRNIKTDINNGGSYYYETNSPYSFLEVELFNDRNSTKASGLIIPKWKEIRLGNLKFDLSVELSDQEIDLHLRSNVTAYQKPTRFVIGESDQQVILFNSPNADGGLSLSEKYETWNSNLETRLFDRQKHEFIPSIIGQGDNPTYKFPIRTAISTATNYNSTSSSLLGNINISFIFEKDVHRSDECIITKPIFTSDINSVNIFRAIVKQLLLMLRNKILLNQGDPSKSELIWLYDSSISENELSELTFLYNKAWNEIFHNKKKSFRCSRVCAGYFYTKNKNCQELAIANLTILINEKFSTVHYSDSNKILIKSFSFGDTAIWNPGLEKRHKILEGIFIKYGRDFISDIIKNMAATDKEKINNILNIFNSQQGPGIQTENIFNFYFTWDHVMHFTDALKRDPYIKLLIFFHFYSIVYFSLKLLKLAKLKTPTSFYVNCQNQKYLSIIESFCYPESLADFLSELFKRTFSSKRKTKILFDIIDIKSEPTSVGGFYYFDEMDVYDRKKKISTGKYYLGEIDPEFKTITYSNIDDLLKESVDTNVKSFIEMFFSQGKKYDLRKDLGIILDEPLEKYKDYCIEHSLQFLELGLSKRLKNVNRTDQVNEPLFFYPIITMIYELSKKFYNDKE